MSRIGKIPVTIPKGAKVAIETSVVRAEGSKGKASMKIPHGISIEKKDSVLMVTRANDFKQSRANHGTIRALLVKMLLGVTDGHKRELEIRGVGFKAQAQGQKLVLNLGFSHPVEMIIPEGVKVATPTPTAINIEGVDNALVGEVAAKIRKVKPPEPYKGKGIRYVGEFVKRKQGKSVTK